MDLQGCEVFRWRIVYSVLSSKAIRISNIRVEDENPGLRDCEVSFLNLISELTNGSKVVINETGTVVRFSPGVVTGGIVEFDCAVDRSVAYYLEPLLLLGPFSKKPFKLTLRGVTNDEHDMSVDVIRTVSLPLIRQFGLDDGALELKINKRGAPPLGGGEVYFTMPTVRRLNPVQVVEVGLVKRIRGIAYATKVSPEFSTRVVKSTRALLNAFIPDVYIYTDHYKGKDSGNSPGYGISVVAETTTGALYSAEAVAGPGQVPEEVGELASRVLCVEIDNGGCIDTSHQALFLSFMALTPEDVSKVRIGKLSPHTVRVLQTMRTFFGTVFKMNPEPETHTVMMTCVGMNLTNFAKKLG